MRIVRVQYKQKIFYASLEGDTLRCLDKRLDLEFDIPLSDVSLVPLLSPSKIICVGLNYRAHAHELEMPLPKEPALFFKPPSAIIGNGNPIVLPANIGRVDYEGELGLVVGQNCRNIRPEDVSSHLFGYTCTNDVTARDLQKSDIFMGRCKSFDSFCPVGAWLETSVDDVNNLGIRTLVNGIVRQDSNTADMVFSPFELVSFISRIMTLLPGDLILTGTPNGIGKLEAGDEVRIEIENVSSLVNAVTTDIDEMDNAQILQ